MPCRTCAPHSLAEQCTVDLTVYERYSRFNGLELTVTGWTYAPYVDNSAASKSLITHC
ncbi:hypothetical protein ACWD3Z_02615 [Streptomyces sp. NPDC002740]